ncbi:unnamed protein product, partial [marine sediment metagenome]
TVDGLSEASYYNIAATPSIVIVDNFQNGGLLIHRS